MVLTILLLGALLTIGEARRPKKRQENRSGACPTEGGKECIFPFKTVCTTAKGPCMFPFQYKGKEYDECTLYQSSGGRAWCATSLKADGNMAQWSACDMEVCTDPHAVGGPYDTCVPSVTTEGKGWCATGVNEDGIFSTRDFCSDPNCVPTPPTTTTKTTTSTTVTTTTVTTTTTTTESKSEPCTTEGGKECLFPFKTVCTTAKGPCVFPFLYKGKEYDECTLYQSSGGRAWCATSLKADGNMAQWSACDMEVCTDPHAVGGPYDKCVPSVTTEGKGWCATGVNEDGIFSTRDFCSNPNCAPTPPTTTTTTTTTTTVTTTSTTATTTEDSDCGCDIPTECILGFSGSVYNTTEDFMGLADFFQRVGGLIEKGVGDLLTFLIPPTVEPPTGLPFGPVDNGTIAPLATTPGESGETAAPGTTAASGTTAAPAGTTAAARKRLKHIRRSNLNRKGLFQDQVQDLILSGERTDCRTLANQISGGALDNGLSLIGMRKLAVLKDNVQEASNRGVFDNIAEFISKAGIVIPEECVCQCGCQKIPTKGEAAATTAAAAADED